MNQQLIQQPLFDNPQGPVDIKFDRMFINSHAKALMSVNGAIAYQCFKVVLVGIFFGLRYGQNIDLKPDYEYWIVVFAGSLIILLAQQLLSMGLKEISLMIAAGIFTGHIFVVEGVAGQNQELRFMVSDIYNSTKPEDPEPSQVDRNIFENNLARSLISFVKMRYRKIEQLNFLGQACNFIVVCAMITLLITQDLPEETYLPVIIFVVIEGLARIKFFVVLVIFGCLLLALPIICCVACFRKNPTAQAFSEQLMPVDYKPSNDINAQVDCSICFTSFAQGEKVIQLPCSNKHIFHEFCIKSWFKVGYTCPICRHDFSRPA